MTDINYLVLESYRTRSNLQPGSKVSIVLKKDQGTDKRVVGIVQTVLSPGAYHTRGIKVMLTDGQVGRVQEILNSQDQEQYPIITFPKVELDSVKRNLNSGIISGIMQTTTRNSCGKNTKIFKVGQIYKTQWGDKVQIVKVIHYDDPTKIPTWNMMNKTMQNSIIYGIKMCGTKNLNWVHIKKI